LVCIASINNSKPARATLSHVEKCVTEKIAGEHTSPTLYTVMQCFSCVILLLHKKNDASSSKVEHLYAMKCLCYLKELMRYLEHLLCTLSAISSADGACPSLMQVMCPLSAAVISVHFP